MNEGVGPQAEEVSLRTYMDIIRRRRLAIVEAVAVALIVGAVYNWMSRPVYSASMRLAIEERALGASSTNTPNALDTLLASPLTRGLGTQMELLQGLVPSISRDAGVPVGSVAMTTEQIGTTEVIRVAATSSDREKVRSFLRALPDTYRQYLSSNRLAEVKNAIAFVEGQLKTAREQLASAERAVHDFRVSTRLPDIEKEREERVKTVAEWQAAVRTARADLEASEALLAQMVRERTALPLKVRATVQSANPEVDALQKQLTEAESARDRLLTRYRPTYREVVEQDRMIAGLRDRIRALPRTVTAVTDVENPEITEASRKIREQKAVIAARRAEAGALEANRPMNSDGLGGYGMLALQLEQLQRETDVRREEVQSLVKSLQELRLRASATRDPVTVIAPVGAALKIAPKTSSNVVYALMTGLVVGLLLALLQEFLDDRINSPEDARRILGAPVLGYIPFIADERMRTLDSANPGGTALESYRVLRSNVQFATVSSPGNSLLVTSTLPGEGKSLTAANLAIAMALDGRSVVVVDSDLRRPTLHQRFGVEQRPGLTDVLVGAASLEEAVKTTSVPGLRVLPAGALPPNAAEMLNSPAQRDLHAALKNGADFVIYDSPPVLSTADAQVLSSYVDSVLYVIQFGEARRSAMRHVIELFSQSHARILGVAFNKIDLSRRRDDYYYGYYRYYNYYYDRSGIEGTSDNGQRQRRERPRALPGQSRGSEPEAAVPDGQSGSGGSS